jgi:mono/diheme cytochrome c family protein
MGARMGADSAEAGMGHGMHHRGEGMQAGRGEGMHRQGEGMHHQGEGMHRPGMGEGMGRMGEGMGRGGMQGQMGATAQREVPEDLQEGERIFKEICSVCHTMDPPPNLAPPMSHVARHLRQEFDTEDAAVAHVVEYLPAPARERSILPDMPHERFGLMAPQPLPAELLEAVGRYVWFLGGES